MNRYAPLQKPDMKFSQLWNLSFGFLGIQIAYALQSANASRIFSTIGVSAEYLSYFWILPPILGMFVQPLVGRLSDRTWTRFGRRLPYLILGTLVATAMALFMPNIGALGLGLGSATLLCMLSLMLMDTSLNTSMQPYKMLVGEMVNERQKGKAYSIQSLLCNTGSVIGFLLPFVIGLLGVEMTAPQGVVPQVVVVSFYIGGAVLLLCMIYSLVKIKEWEPGLYARYNPQPDASEKTPGVMALLRKAPGTFWSVGLVQFFNWFAFLFMWTYCTGTVAQNTFHTPEIQRVSSIRLSDGSVLKLSDMTVTDASGRVLLRDGVDSEGLFAALPAGASVIATPASSQGGEKSVTIPDVSKCEVRRSVELDASSDTYSQAGNWVGVLYAVQAFGSVLWALVLPRFRNRKFSYGISMAIGAVGFLLSGLISDKWLLFVPYLMIGTAWSASMAWPFAFLTDSLKGRNVGSYMGLFNCSICLPQIIAAICGGFFLSLMTVPGEPAPQYMMMILAGVSLALATVAVAFIRDPLKASSTRKSNLKP